MAGSRAGSLASHRDRPPVRAHPQVSPGVIANPFAGVSRRNSLESVSSIDRELSPDAGKVSAAGGRQPGAGGPEGPKATDPDRWPLCPQEKELPGQAPPWGTEATVSAGPLHLPSRL